MKRGSDEDRFMLHPDDVVLLSPEEQRYYELQARSAEIVAENLAARSVAKTRSRLAGLLARARVRQPG